MFMVFTKLIMAMRLSMYVQRMYVMFTHLSTQMLQREMYVCMYAILYVYDFTESNITTRYYVFRKWHGKRCILFSITVKMEIKIL